MQAFDASVRTVKIHIDPEGKSNTSKISPIEILSGKSHDLIN